MIRQDARALQTRLAAEFEHEPEHEAAVAYADAQVANLEGEKRQRDHTLAYQFAREYYARVRTA